VVKTERSALAKILTSWWAVTCDLLFSHSSLRAQTSAPTHPFSYSQPQLLHTGYAFWIVQKQNSRLVADLQSDAPAANWALSLSQCVKRSRGAHHWRMRWPAAAVGSESASAPRAAQSVSKRWSECWCGAVSLSLNLSLSVRCPNTLSTAATPQGALPFAAVRTHFENNLCFASLSLPTAGSDLLLSCTWCVSLSPDLLLANFGIPLEDQPRAVTSSLNSIQLNKVRHNFALSLASDDEFNAQKYLIKIIERNLYSYLYIYLRIMGRRLLFCSFFYSSFRLIGDAWEIFTLDGTLDLAKFLRLILMWLKFFLVSTAAYKFSVGLFLGEGKIWVLTYFLPKEIISP